MNPNQTNRSLANVCLYCNESLKSPSICKFCGFKFCDEHYTTENHQCIKTRYFEYLKKTEKPPDISHGKFRVVCNICGYTSKKPTPIEYAGEELIQHTQMIGCSQNIFLEEAKLDDLETKQIMVNPSQGNLDPMYSVNNTIDSNVSKETSIVEQIIRISSLKEKGMISEDEFNFIKKELIKKLK